MKYRCFKAQIYWLSYYSENSEHEYVNRVIDNRGAFTRFARYSDRVSSYHQGKSTTCEHLFTVTGGFIWQSGKAAVCSAVNPTNARPTIENNELNNILLFYLVVWRQQYIYFFIKINEQFLFRLHNLFSMLYLCVELIQLKIPFSLSVSDVF